MRKYNNHVYNCILNTYEGYHPNYCTAPLGSIVRAKYIVDLYNGHKIVRAHWKVHERDLKLYGCYSKGDESHSWTFANEDSLTPVLDITPCNLQWNDETYVIDDEDDKSDVTWPTWRK